MWEGATSVRVSAFGILVLGNGGVARSRRRRAGSVRGFALGNPVLELISRLLGGDATGIDSSLHLLALEIDRLPCRIDLILDATPCILERVDDRVGHVGRDLL